MANPNQFLFNANELGVEIPPNFNTSPFRGNDNIDTMQFPYTQFDHPTPTYTHSPDTSSSASASQNSTTFGSKRRKKTSEIWQHYEEEEYVDGDGVTKMRARCLHPGCSSKFSLQKGGGHGYMRRHLATHAKQDGQAAAIQSRINFNPDGTPRGIFVYDATRQREAPATLIAVNDLPLGFGESHGFVEYIRTAHTPSFTPVSRQTTTRDMKKLAKAGLAALKEELGSSTFSIAITSDIWSGRAKQDYITVVVHYVSSNWELNKRIIGFELIDVSHNGENIAHAILKVVSEFGLAKKIFAVTLDHASANTTAIKTLIPTFEVYASKFLLHQRCACHIINLIAKSALDGLEPYIERLRMGISWLNASNTRLGSYRNYCVVINVPCHGLHLDMPVRWNSTYLMLQLVIRDKTQFSAFVNAHFPQEDGYHLLGDDTWHIAESIYKFLATFNESTITLSGVYYPTYHMIVHHILEIAQHLKEYENDTTLLVAVHNMKEKFLKYWKTRPLLYTIAFILDPRAKMEGFSGVLSLLSYTVNVSYDQYSLDIKDKLQEVYSKYELKYGAALLHRPPAVPTAGRGKKKVWGKIFGTSTTTPSSSTGSSTQTPMVQGGGELAKYLNSLVVATNDDDDDDDDFDILQWWQDKRSTYPVLSILAQDVLSMPVSTVSSESAFSLAGRIIDDRRTSLTPEMVKTLMSVKDGELARRRAQHTTENPELIASFEAMRWTEDQEET
uniref:Uncharacterized protein n=1 Tax=Avena sativa TaxID=4498 RepID=A0ACD5UJM8_AVESA